MAPPKKEKSHLKRARQTIGEHDLHVDKKKPRRSQRISSQHGHVQQKPPSVEANTADISTPLKKGQLPSPLTHKESTKDTVSDGFKEGTVTPPEGRPSQIRHRATPPPSSSPVIVNGLSSPPADTQPFSQVYPSKYLSHEVKDEEGEGVWGYLIPLDHRFGDTLVLRQRSACPNPKARAAMKTDGKRRARKNEYQESERKFEETKINGASAGGYLIGRHPECDRILNVPTISNRHCLIFRENRRGDTIALVEDLSGNGTFVNEAYVGRNKRRELHDFDEIAVLDEARFVFRYPRTRHANGFKQQFSIQQQLGKGHFATVYLAVERCSGMKYAVKKFEKKSGSNAKSQAEGLQQEIAVLMGVSHPNVLCLKDTFDEADGVYLVLELAAEGELFNLVVMRSKLTEIETRKIFIQLFEGLKYLHERNIVHRDLKPENILLIDRDLSVKLADFGLAKIIGEESFTTTLCGTPSYVAPEILESSNHRRYTRAVDIWSLGVVLYICLCGFPPFSDELYSPENPYNLSEQIKLGRFDYPSPYWDSVSDLALDLIDRMLTVEVERRITIDECLEHPWTTHEQQNSGGSHNRSQDSTDGLAGKMGQLDFSKRKPVRERTLLSSINDIRVAKVMDVDRDATPIKVFEKNRDLADRSQGFGPLHKNAINGNQAQAGMEADDGSRQFMQLGRASDNPLFANDVDSRYPPENKLMA